MELYKKTRPQKLTEIIGQDDVVKKLRSFKRSTLPHAMLFEGPSGVGKTTVARILTKRLKTHEINIQEINSADFRGIDMVRELQETIFHKPLTGDTKVFIIDECHQLTKPAQDAFLKVLEETPEHAYIILCTTEATKLKKTLRTRCSVFNFKKISHNDLVKIVTKTFTEHKEDDYEMRPSTFSKIADVADGSARAALQILEQVMPHPHDQQFEMVCGISEEDQTQNLARHLLQNSGWATIAKYLQDCTEDPEKLRYAVLGYMATVMLNAAKSDKGARAAAIAEHFSESFAESGKAGLILACYNIKFPN